MDQGPADLRVVPHAHNMQNRTRPNKKNTSGYRGVYFKKNRGTWEAWAGVKYMKHYIGSFRTPEDAARAAHEWRLKNMPGYTGALYEMEKTS